MHGGLVSGEGEWRVYAPSYSIIRADAVLRRPAQKNRVHSDRSHREVSDGLRACECKRVDMDTQTHKLVFLFLEIQRHSLYIISSLSFQNLKCPNLLFSTRWKCTVFDKVESSF